MLQTRRLSVIAMFLVLTFSACFADDGKRTPAAAPESSKTRVACIGDSITAGYGVTPGNSYPSQLARMLGTGWNVENFGVSASTLLNSGDLPYQRQEAFARSLDFKPDIVIIMLGSNDTKPQNWKHIGEFNADYKSLIGKYAALESKPRIFIARPCVVLGAGAFGLTEENLKSELPKIDVIAKETGAEVVDIHAVTAAAARANPALLSDNVHPNAEGSAILSAAIFKAINGKVYDGPSCIVTTKPKAAATQPTAK